MANATNTETDENPVTAAVRQIVKAPAAKATEPAEEAAAATEDEPAEEAEADDAAPFTKADGKPFTAKDHAALDTALKAARKDARDAKAETTRLTAAAGGKDVAVVLAEAETTAEAKWKPLMVRAAARGAFAEAGLTVPEGAGDSVFTRAVQLLDLTALTISDDGLVEGLAEQVEEIRGDFPGLFATADPAPRVKPPRLSAADKPPATKPKTAAELLAARLTGAA